MLRDAGLVDAAARVSSFPANTFNSASRYQRIDYIWVSPDLTVEEVFVPGTTASAASHYTSHKQRDRYLPCQQCQRRQP